MAREAATHVLLGHAHYRAVEHADFDAATKAIAPGRPVRRQGPARAVRGVGGAWALDGAAVRDGRGLVPDDPARPPRAARLTTVGTPLSAHDEVRILVPGSETDVADA